MQGGCQNEETKKHGPYERKDQNSKKKLNNITISNLSDAEFKTHVIRILKELFGYFNIIKKTQAEMKVTLSEIKKNLQGTNSGMDEAKNQINDLEHTETKNNQADQQKKKNPEKRG